MHNRSGHLIAATRTHVGRITLIAGPCRSSFAVQTSSFTVGGFGDRLYAHPGSNNFDLGPGVFEQAQHFRTGANTYASISSGWMDEVGTDRGVQSTQLHPTAFLRRELFNQLWGKPIWPMATPSPWAPKTLPTWSRATPTRS